MATDISPTLFAQRFLEQVDSNEVRFKTGNTVSIPASVLAITNDAGLENDGLIPVHQLIRADAVLSLGNTTNATDMFLTDLTVKAATQYRFTLRYSALTGATSTTLSFLFSAAQTATFTTIAYHSLAVDAAANTAAAALLNSSAVGTAVVVGAAGTGVVKRIWIDGEFETLAGGTLIPQIKFSADPTGTCQTQVGSFFEAWEVGTAPITTLGPWA